ncbi:hypothetical protein [Brevibacillus thermoruber]|uniref:hypothetical protein n=1 Tax=Brevibacillus thermoruber TaxID=33942 RepID=UPI000558E5FF|nr:hypothetical protein [Brevibacillus thermoruber]
MKKKRLLSILLSLLLITIFFGISSNVNASAQDQKFVFEEIDIEDLDKHPDVKQKIIEDGFGDYIKKEKSYREMSKLYDLSELESNYLKKIKGVPAKEVERIIKQYNLPNPEVYVKEDSQVLLVKRNIETNSIDGVIAFNLLVSDEGATLTLVHLDLGVDPVDSVTGEIRKYNANGTKWELADTKKISKRNVDSGTLVTWSEDIDAVSDYFEYELIVVDNGVSYHYKGGGKKKTWQRYNFEVDRYKDLDALGGHRHHFVSATPLQNVGFNSNYAPAIRMLVKDHQNTPSYGGGGISHRNQEEKYLREQRYSAVLDFNVQGFRNADDSEGYYSSLLTKYYSAVVEALYMYEAYFDMR